ncbi:multiple epidermal growth factor-like domains protein 8 [Chiloscyllium punctatum]|uniref:multiple epidermal growth factor-like domains protein 8 n=1 Tax=Chiloscyllium punctatum TaxID=137246 RepID=UPI003B633204
MGVTASAASRGRRPGAVHSPALLHLLLLLLLLGHRGRAGECKGHRQELNQQPGYVTDGPGNYSVSGNCEWLIRAPNSSFRIILTFMFLDTECAYDYLFIYDGDSYSSPLLASLSGNTLPEPIEARSGKMLLHLFSDANYNLLGFNATYTFTLCPRGCSGHGTCDLSGSCTCHFGWSGAACNIQNCSDTCGPYGHCVAAQHCQCQPGFIGHNCDLSLNDNQSAGSWYNVSRSDPEFTGRTAAAGTFLNTTNSLYIFGGFDLNQVLGDLVRYNFTSNQWHRSTASPSPPARHSHSAVEWRGRMLIFGGQLANGSLLSDIWLYEAVPESWKLLSASTSLTPPGLASHAATLVDHYLYVYGGRTDVDRFSSRMFRFNLLNWIWEEVIPTGGKSPAMAAHSMVFHPASRTLLIFGGHRVSPRFSFRTNTTNIFHVDERYWTELRSTPSPSSPRERAFHTATIVGNYMVVYGGNVHIHYQEEKCYDGDIFFYHLDCHQWVSSEELRLSVSAGDGDVFFSCFFLFLSVCVLLWKLKQFVNFQQEHRRHIQEMNKMASRPFAHLAVYLEPDPELLLLPLRHQLGHRLKAHRSPDGGLLPQLLGLAQPGFRVGPITLEPTDDGMAAVATLMCQLPGGPLAPNRACLGSALVTIRHNLQEYCSSAYGASNSRKAGGGGGISHDNLTSMSM